MGPLDNITDRLKQETTQYDQLKMIFATIKKYASDLQTLLAVKQIEKEVETHDMGLQALVYGDSLNQTKLAYKIDTGLKTIVTSIQKFGKVVVESKPCELTFTRKKEKQ